MKAETKMSILFKVKEIVCYSVLSRSELKKSIGISSSQRTKAFPPFAF